jgi:hypothetical protein
MQPLVHEHKSGQGIDQTDPWTDAVEGKRAFSNGHQAYGVISGRSDAQIIEGSRGCGTGQRSRRVIRKCEPPTIIEAHVELGLHFNLFVRGQGGGLTWEKGTPLAHVNPHTWIWAQARLHGRVVFQLLLDDLVWARGPNRVLEAGRRIEVAPDFEWPDIPRTC